VGTIALIAGWALIGIGLILLMLPLLNAVLNERTARGPAARRQPAEAVSATP